MSRLGNILGDIIDRQNPGTLIRPLSSNATSTWTYTAPSTGLFYATIACSGARQYIQVTRNGSAIAGYALPTASNTVYMNAMSFYLKKGDTLQFVDLSSTTFLRSGLTAFVPMGGGYCLTALSRLATSARRWSHEQVVQDIRRNGKEWDSINGYMDSLKHISSGSKGHKLNNIAKGDLFGCCTNSLYLKRKSSPWIKKRWHRRSCTTNEWVTRAICLRSVCCSIIRRRVCCIIHIRKFISYLRCFSERLINCNPNCITTIPERGCVA